MSNAEDAQQQWQQMQAMQAMLSMGQGGMPPMNEGGMPGFPAMPAIDPNMAQAYLAMLQAMTQQQSLGSGMPPMPGMPPMSFPGMPPMPYAPAAPPEATVEVCVEGMKFHYQLTEDDLRQVFSRYGTIKAVQVDPAGAAAKITFVNLSDAQNAMTDLHGKVLNGLEGTLRIEWASQTSLPPAYPQSMGFPGMGMLPFPGASPGGYAAPAPAPAPHGGHAGSMAPPQMKAGKKYTCRFIIGIDNDKEFHVARRLIGVKGTNMKRIVGATDAKLRLRGQGSGYLEGTGQKESCEPLQLCVSCTNADHYTAITQQVDSLLQSVYDEYTIFCRDSGKPAPNLKINCSENLLEYSRSAPQDQDGGDGPRRQQVNRRGKGVGKGKTPTGDGDRGEPGPNAPPVDEIEKMIEARNEARRASNFREADRIREALHAQGVALMDEPGGRGKGSVVTTWRHWRD